MLERTPWFNTKKQPPVHDGTYETTCMATGKRKHYGRWTRQEIIRYACPACEWRGLTKPAHGGSDE